MINISYGSLIAVLFNLYAYSNKAKGENRTAFCSCIFFHILILYFQVVKNWENKVQQVCVCAIHKLEYANSLATRY